MGIFLDSVSAWFHRITGDVKAQVRDIEDFTRKSGLSPKGSLEEATYFCMADEQSKSLLGQKFDLKECHLSLQNFRTASEIIKRINPALKK